MYATVDKITRYNSRTIDG